MVNIGQGPCGVGDDCTWLAEGLKTLSVLIPDKKCKHHGIMLLSVSRRCFPVKEGCQNVPYDNMTIECESRNMNDS